MSEPNLSETAGTLREEDSEILPALAPADVYDPVIEAYKKDVDRTLIRENLKLTPEQRLRGTADSTRAGRRPTERFRGDRRTAGDS